MKKIIITFVFFELLLNSINIFPQNLIDGLNGSGTESAPVLISSVEDLRLLSAFVMNDANYSTYTAGKYFVLTNDIIFQYYDNIYDFDNDGTNESNFIPIGGRQSPTEANDYRLFQGIFDGRGYTISGMQIKYSGVNYVGLFGCTWSCEIRNLGIEDSEFAGYGCIAPICGQLRGNMYLCYVRNCIVNNDYWFTGGLIGATYGSSNVNNCYTINCQVTGTQWVGGFVGNNNNNSQILNSYSTNTVYTTNSSSYYGGFNGSNEDECLITNCHYIDTWKGTPDIEQIPQAELGFEKTLEFMQTQNFVDILNAEQDSIIISVIPEVPLGAIWYSDNNHNINNGLPIFWWEKDFITNMEYFSINNFSVYPNPAKDFIKLNINKDLNNCEIFVFDISGKEILKRKIYNETTIDINNFKSGYYSIKLFSDNNFKGSTKILIQK